MQHLFGGKFAKKLICNIYFEVRLQFSEKNTFNEILKIIYPSLRLISLR